MTKKTDNDFYKSTLILIFLLRFLIKNEYVISFFSFIINTFDHITLVAVPIGKQMSWNGKIQYEYTIPTKAKLICYENKILTVNAHSLLSVWYNKTVVIMAFEILKVLKEFPLTSFSILSTHNLSFFLCFSLLAYMPSHPYINPKLCLFIYLPIIQCAHVADYVYVQQSIHLSIYISILHLIFYLSILHLIFYLSTYISV